MIYYIYLVLFYGVSFKYLEEVENNVLYFCFKLEFFYFICVRMYMYI